MAGAPLILNFEVRRRKRELVSPAKPTPYEFKTLSDIDDQEILRFYRSGIYFYNGDPSKGRRDPAKVIKSAVSEALVHYYPLAGRIRELQPTRKLIVECTGDTLVLVEADADARLEDFGTSLTPPVPSYEKLLCEPESPTGVVVDRPLLYFQVTRLSCGGFIFGFQICHCMADGTGIIQFLTALTEFARGVPGEPTVRPLWERELFTARWPPVVRYDHPEYKPVLDPCKDMISPADSFVHQPFFFGPGEIAMLRMQAPPHLRSTSSRFDLVAAFMWRCRTAALLYDPDDEVRLQIFVNSRVGKRSRRPVPSGYYGNAFTFTVASAAAGELCRKPLGHALQLLADAKAQSSEEGYIQSVAAFMAACRRPPFPKARIFLVSDLTQAGLLGVDFGWGRPVYGWPATTMLAVFHLEGRNEVGEKGILVPMRLPAPAIERFKLEIKKGLTGAEANAKMDGRDNASSSMKCGTVLGKL